VSRFRFSISPPNHPEAFPLERRGYRVGWVHPLPGGGTAPPSVERWRNQHAIHLPGLLGEAIDSEALTLTEGWVEGVLMEEAWETLLDRGGVSARIGADFTWAATVYDDTDPQAIARLDFETREGQEIWMKASWLSLHEEDASLRFRFSHGLDRYEDVAADLPRQLASNALCERFFPESRWLTEHAPLRERLRGLIGTPPLFVERIVYFNAPRGGAQFHQDVERGHEGVVYAQLSGETFWFALPKAALVDHLRVLLTAPEQADERRRLLGGSEARRLQAQAADACLLDRLLDDPEEEALHVFLNRSPSLAQRLVATGAAYHLRPGDCLLLPQRDLSHCCWHSVFTVGEFIGQALSFAIRKT